MLFSFFERQLKNMYPSSPEITYELRDVYQWLDTLVRSLRCTGCRTAAPACLPLTSPPACSRRPAPWCMSLSSARCAALPHGTRGLAACCRFDAKLQAYVPWNKGWVKEQAKAYLQRQAGYR